MKKVFAVVMALLFSLSMMVTVWADDTAAADGFVSSVTAEDAPSDDTNGVAGFYGTNVITDTSDSADEEAPNTGDNNNIALWASVFAVSCGAAAVLVVNRRKAKAGK